MFDLGEGDRAFQIAQTALETWEKEAELTYHSAEHFSIETGRGAGWHQFSALSTPILSWFSAYFRPGTITSGFDTWIKESSFSREATSLKAVLHRAATGNSSVVLVCMKEGKKYSVKAAGKVLQYKEVVGGALQIMLPATMNDTIELQINSL